METLTPPDERRRYPPAAPTPPQTNGAATLVTAFYLSLVLCAPLIVRYAPAMENSVATRIADRPAVIRCASAPGYGLPCGATAAPEVRMPPLHAARRATPDLV